MAQVEQQKMDSMMRRLRGLLDDDVPTKAEFTQLVEALVKHIETIDNRLSRDFQALTNQVKLLSREIQGKHDMSLSDMKKRLNELFVGERVSEIERLIRTEVRSELDNQVQKVETKLSTVKDGTPGKDGRDANENLIVARVTAVVQNMFKDQEKKINDKLAKRPIGRMGMKRITATRAVNLSGDVDGQKRVFTIPTDTRTIHGGLMSQFPFALHVNDLTRSSATEITLHATVPTPERGQTLIIFVDTLFNV